MRTTWNSASRRRSAGSGTYADAVVGAGRSVDRAGTAGPATARRGVGSGLRWTSCSTTRRTSAATTSTTRRPRYRRGARSAAPAGVAGEQGDAVQDDASMSQPRRAQRGVEQALREGSRWTVERAEGRSTGSRSRTSGRQPAEPAPVERQTVQRASTIRRRRSPDGRAKRRRLRPGPRDRGRQGHALAGARPNHGLTSARRSRRAFQRSRRATRAARDSSKGCTYRWSMIVARRPRAGASAVLAHRGRAFLGVASARAMPSFSS